MGRCIVVSVTSESWLQRGAVDRTPAITTRELEILSEELNPKYELLNAHHDAERSKKNQADPWYDGFGCILYPWCLVRGHNTR
jgi:hypothetical protein